MNINATLMLLVIGLTSLGNNQTHEIQMTAMTYTPKQLTIKRGDKIRFVNTSSNYHNAVFTFVETKLLRKGESVEVEFKNVGEFPFFCRPHISMGMKGVITVKE